MTARRNALGRGLGALIPPPSQSPAPGSQAARGRGAAAVDREVFGPPSEIPIDQIAPNPDQPRRVFDERELQRLADSIQRHGVLQPVVVQEAPAAASHRYELLVGERRWRAAQLAGRQRLPATVQDVDPDERLAVALVENVQRQDLNPIEMAHAFHSLAERGATQEEIGRSVGLDRSSVANHLRLLELPRALQEDLEGGVLSMGHAKALLTVANPQRRHHLRDRIVAEGLSVRATEAQARRLAPAASGAQGARGRGVRAAGGDPNLQSLVDQLRARLQTKVQIQGRGDRGKIEIEFYGPEELNRLAEILLGGARP